MIPSVMIVMLIWVGSATGGAATISGFGTMAACEQSRPQVSAFYQLPTYGPIFIVFTKCLELPK